MRFTLPEGLQFGTDGPDPTESCVGTATSAECQTSLTIGTDPSRRSVGWAWDIVANRAGSYVLRAEIPQTSVSDPDAIEQHGLCDRSCQRGFRRRGRGWLGRRWQRRDRGFHERRETLSGEAEGRLPRHRERPCHGWWGRRAADPSCVQRNARRYEGEGHAESDCRKSVLRLPHAHGGEGEDAQGSRLLQRPREAIHETLLDEARLVERVEERDERVAGSRVQLEQRVIVERGRARG